MPKLKSDELILISHSLCPYVQRAAISLAEKNIAFSRIYIDLSDKPDWFLEISPLGKVPLLRHGENVIFESAVILEYIEEITEQPLHPRSAIERARHRSAIEFGSSILNSIAGFYSAGDIQSFEIKVTELAQRFSWLETQLCDDAFFAGDKFSLVDATFGPVFRYFDLFDQIDDFGILNDKPKISAWRKALAQRASIQNAVAQEYPDLLRAFVEKRASYLSKLLANR
jgi:glutathione S-transferase